MRAAKGKRFERRVRRTRVARQKRRKVRPQQRLGIERQAAPRRDVQRGASETGSASSQVLAAAQSLSGDSNRLKLEVGRFLDSVRAA